MSTNNEKANQVQLEDASSGDVAPRDEAAPPDEMSWQAFMAIVVSSQNHHSHIY